MLCRWQTSLYEGACLQLRVNYFVRVRKKQSVSGVEVTCLFAVAEAELVLKLGAAVVPVGPIETEPNPGSSGCA